MAVATINETAYARLLARTLPRVIKTEKENERIVAELERLDTRGQPAAGGLIHLRDSRNTSKPLTDAC